MHMTVPIFDVFIFLGLRSIQGTSGNTDMATLEFFLFSFEKSNLYL